MNVEYHEPGVGGRYGAVEKTLRGGEAGAVCGGGARVVKYVVTGDDIDTVDLGLVRENGGNHAGIGDIVVGRILGLGM